MRTAGVALFLVALVVSTTALATNSSDSGGSQNAVGSGSGLCSDVCRKPVERAACQSSYSDTDKQQCLYDVNQQELQCMDACKATAPAPGCSGTSCNQVRP